MTSGTKAAEPGRQVVVLAGGLANRLGTLTADKPKYLLPVAGRAFAFHQFELLAACGVADVVLCIGHHGHAIEAALRGGRDAGIRVRYSHEGEARLGTLGALTCALPLLEDSFVLTYGDSYLPFDYLAPLRALRNAPDAHGCMAVYANDNRHDRSNVALGPNNTVARYCKGHSDPTLTHIDYGAIALRREIIAAQSPGPADLAPLLAELANAGGLLAHPVQQRFYEIGSPAGYAELCALLEQRLDAASSSGQDALPQEPDCSHQS